MSDPTRLVFAIASGKTITHAEIEDMAKKIAAESPELVETEAQFTFGGREVIILKLWKDLDDEIDYDLDDDEDDDDEADGVSPIAFLEDYIRKIKEPLDEV